MDPAVQIATPARARHPRAGEPLPHGGTCPTFHLHGAQVPVGAAPFDPINPGAPVNSLSSRDGCPVRVVVVLVGQTISALP